MEDKINIKSDKMDATLSALHIKQRLENKTDSHDETINSKSELYELNDLINVVKQTHFRSQENQDEELIEDCKILTPKVSIIELSDLASHFKEKFNLDQSFTSLSTLIRDLKNQPPKMQVTPTPQPTNVKNGLIAELTKKIEFQERKLGDMENLLRKYRENDEVYGLRDQINDLRHIISELQLENAKLELESGDMKEELVAAKEERAQTEETLDHHIKLSKQYQDDKEELKTIISETQNLNLRLKKEMIEKLNETNRAKRMSMDSEISLQQVSMAYKAKRKEVNKYMRKLEQAEAIIASYENGSQI